VSRAIFLDTSAWFAAMNPREAAHPAALAAYEQALRTGATLVTTNLVLGEMQVLLMRLLGPGAGVEFLDQVRADARHEVVWCDAELGQAAVDRWLRPFRAERLSLCDAVSFEVMDRRRISWALTLDRRFRVAGYGVLPAGDAAREGGP
jgi:predicted nucleic acid-binding protein